MKTLPLLLLALLSAPQRVWGLVQTTATISQARYDLGATSAGNFALFAGGYSLNGNTVSGEYSAVVDIFDANNRMWTTASLSQARYDLAATSVGGLALFAGGFNHTGYSAVVDIFDANTKIWTTVYLSQSRSNLVATSVGDLALFAGGGSSLVSSSVVDIFDANTKIWTTASLSRARSNLAATSVGSLALFAGGYRLKDDTDIAVVDIFDASTRTWNTSSLSQARYDLAATSVGDLALFAGGRNSVVGDSAVVDIFDANTKRWTTASLSQARSNLAATSVGSLAFFAGGYRYNTSPISYSAVVDIFDANTRTWSTASLSQARSNLAATSLGSLTLFAGGGSNNNTNPNSAVVDIFEPPTPTSGPTSSPPTSSPPTSAPTSAASSAPQQPCTTTGAPCEVCLAAGCSYCKSSLGSTAYCTTDTACFAGGGTPVASCSPNFTTCVAAPAKNRCDIPAGGTILRVFAQVCDAVNDPKPIAGTTGTTTGSATTGVSPCSISLAQPACVRALRDYSCTSSCGQCPDPLNFDPQNLPRPCPPVCAAVFSACSDAIANGCLTSPVCGQAGNCSAKVAYIDDGQGTSNSQRTANSQGTDASTTASSASILGVTAVLAPVALLFFNS